MKAVFTSIGIALGIIASSLEILDYLEHSTVTTTPSTTITTNAPAAATASASNAQNKTTALITEPAAPKPRPQAENRPTRPAVVIPDMNSPIFQASENEFAPPPPTRADGQKPLLKHALSNDHPRIPNPNSRALREEDFTKAPKDNW